LDEGVSFIGGAPPVLSPALPQAPQQGDFGEGFLSLPFAATPGSELQGTQALQRSAFNSTHELTVPVSRSRIPTSRTTLWYVRKGAKL